MSSSFTSILRESIATAEQRRRQQANRSQQQQQQIQQAKHRSNGLNHLNSSDGLARSQNDIVVPRLTELCASALATPRVSRVCFGREEERAAYISLLYLVGPAEEGGSGASSLPIHDDLRRTLAACVRWVPEDHLRLLEDDAEEIPGALDLVRSVTEFRWRLLCVEEAQRKLANVDVLEKRLADKTWRERLSYLREATQRRNEKVLARVSAATAKAKAARPAATRVQKISAGPRVLGRGSAAGASRFQGSTSGSGPKRSEAMKRAMRAVGRKGPEKRRRT
jgi:hypothetical protein